MRTALDHHEAAGTIDSEAYQAAYMEFFSRHICRPDPWPEAATRTFAQINQTIYERMQGPNEMLITGIHRDYDISNRLGDLSVPTLFMCGRYGSNRPEDTAWYHSLVPGAELVVFERSSHVPHLEEPDKYLEAVGEFMHRAERTPRDRRR